MIFIFNLLISFFSLLAIALIQYFPHLIKQNYFKNHLIIFILKFLFISMFIYIFIFNFSISDYTIFIISGYFNFTFFHIIEGIINQKILLKND